MRFLGVDPAASEGIPPPAPAGLRRPALRVVFVAATLFFTVGPLLNLLQHRPDPAPFALLLAGWVVFATVLVRLFQASPVGARDDSRFLAVACAALVAIAFAADVAFGVPEALALYYYAGVTAARLVPQARSIAAIGGVSLLAVVGMAIATGDPAAGVDVGVTVGTISLTLSALAAQGRTNRELHAARLELAQAAVADERTRIARDLHDTLGHSLSLIALKSELARRVIDDDPARAAAEIGDVEHAAREALASVRETVSGYRRPSLGMELARARDTFRTAGIRATVEPAPEGLPRDVDALLGWAVREGVTNVLRHSAARSARIRVLREPARVAVEITDDGTGPHGPALPNGGSGLPGLRERAGLLGGGLEAARATPGGFRLAVWVPVEPAG